MIGEVLEGAEQTARHMGKGEEYRTFIRFAVKILVSPDNQESRVIVGIILYVRYQL